MTTLRSYIDPDQQKGTMPTPFATEENEHDVRCGMCAREFSIDEETFRSMSEAIESGLDNPFRCEICSVEYDDLAYEG